MLLAQRQHQRGVADIWDVGAEGISLCGLQRTLEVTVDFSALERDAGDVTGVELVQEGAVRQPGQFA